MLPPIAPSSAGQSLAASRPTPAHTDHFYQQQLQQALAGRHAVVLVGHSGAGYIDPEALREHIGGYLQGLLQSPDTHAETLMVVAGGTPDGIGIAYNVAQEMGLHTMGVVAHAGRERVSPDCRTTIVVHNEDPESWSTRMPESGEEMVVSVLRTAHDAGLGGRLLAFNGGPQAYNEALAAAKAGFPVTLLGEHDPVPTGRPEPFKEPVKLQALSEAIAPGAQVESGTSDRLPGHS